MSQMRLANLVSALASAVAEAEHHVRVQQIRNLHSFFAHDNQPVSVDLMLPRSSTDVDAGSSSVKVPLITLINLSHMSISEMEIKFSTSLGEVTVPQAEDQGGGVSFAAETAAQREERRRKELGWSEEVPIFIEVASGPTTSESGAASVSLRVRQGETPEGLARILTLLNRNI